MNPNPSQPRCISLDLEINADSSKIYASAAVRPDLGQALKFQQDKVATGWAKIDRLADGASFVLGHNLIKHDLPYLKAAQPTLRLLQMPAVDTLWLSPLAHPRNPYHRLIKHYKDGRLVHTRRNDPELDARLALDVFSEQEEALRAVRNTTPDLLAAWHWLSTVCAESGECGARGFDIFFSDVRGAARPSDSQARAAVDARLQGMACRTQSRAIVADAARYGWSLAYALAWLSVAGGNSVMPPWVRHQFPEAGELLHRLRCIACPEADCDWCRERHDARKELKRWFGFEGFRPHPQDEEQGKPMQQAIVEASMAGKNVLGILPTGTGKSVCYQVPALSRYDKSGALTVVISPLVALMADQVRGLEQHNIACCATINGLLSMPERKDVLDRVRLGDVGILIIAPEQLRSRSINRVLAQREVGLWVMDEAHCLSQWGHDFRPDYRYVARYIKERRAQSPTATVLCLTATAKQEVKAEIKSHFRDQVGLDLQIFDGGASRDNLQFEVVKTSEAEKLAHLHQILSDDLPADTPGGAIIYCATRGRSEEIAAFLCAQEMKADYFHAGLSPERKRDVQERFIEGKLRAIAATNAFGMGIDKSDVRLVLHADIPGSLENYLQEAGRAGRDGEIARCVLLYVPDDVERQFKLSARTRLSRREINALLKSLRRLKSKKHADKEVVATVGEILGEDEEAEFERDRGTEDTRALSAISWLEDAEFLQRAENQVQVFPSSLRVDSLKQAADKLRAKVPDSQYRKRLLDIVEALIDADPDEGISTDELLNASGLKPKKLRHALYHLEELGLTSNDAPLTAYVHAGVQRSSHKRLQEATDTERVLIEKLQETAPDMDKGDSHNLHLRPLNQDLKDAGCKQVLPEKVLRLLRGIAKDGHDEDGGTGSLRLRPSDSETVRLTLQRDWKTLSEIAERRRAGAGVLLEHLLACLPPHSQGVDLLAETTVGRLSQALRDDMALKSQVRNFDKLLDHALLWLHEQEVIRLNKGLTIFRPAMTIRMSERRDYFTGGDFKPLELHYQGRTLFVHVMAEYAQRGLQAIADALSLALDYFALEQQAFLQRWLPNRELELQRQTTPDSWNKIVAILDNTGQKRIVADERKQTNVLVLAGPGSGKTRVLVHRIAYLVRVLRVNPGSIIALSYNRHAATEIRRRLKELIDDDSRGLTVMTCHGFAMRLVGASFKRTAEQTGKPNGDSFKQVLRQATDVLRGKGLSPDDGDEQRQRLLGRFSWILVDEYQDIDEQQYELISALAGRMRDEDDKLNLFAVGDDDQNIYAYDGASVEFLRRFEQDYQARPAFLLDNYRSTKHIIDAANAIIQSADQRMKSNRPVRVNRARAKDAPGGAWRKLDPVAQGRVQILPTPSKSIAQAQVAMLELQRLGALAQNWDWSKCAVLARRWDDLEPVRAWCEQHRIPAQMGNEENLLFWRLRETQMLLNWLDTDKPEFVDKASLKEWLARQAGGPWFELLGKAVEDYADEFGAQGRPQTQFTEWLAEWGREIRRRQRGLLLSTVHRAKGLEFDHVVVLDGDWQRRSAGEDADASRRLYYVAMTRARHTLTLMRFDDRRHPFLDDVARMPAFLQRKPVAVPPPDAELALRYWQLTPGDVDLGYAGRCNADDLIHHRIKALSPGAALRVRKHKERWEILDGQGGVVGHIAKKSGVKLNEMRYHRATVAAIIIWRRTDSEPEYQGNIRRDTWEVVLPELTLAPINC